MWQLLLVSALWGCTNPLMREGSQPNEVAGEGGHVHKLLRFASNWRFLVPFALNQCGSLLYMKCLGEYPISTAVPISTALTSFFTCLTAYCLGERALNRQTLLALALIIAGTVLCQLN